MCWGQGKNVRNLIVMTPVRGLTLDAGMSSRERECRSCVSRGSLDDNGEVGQRERENSRERDRHVASIGLYRRFTQCIIGQEQWPKCGRLGRERWLTQWSGATTLALGYPWTAMVVKRCRGPWRPVMWKGKRRGGCCDRTVHH